LNRHIYSGFWAPTLAKIGRVSSTKAEPAFGDVLALCKPELLPICVSLRSLIGKLDPAFVELVWPKQKIASFGIGPKKMSEHYAYIAVHSAHINLGFYQGASLKDPQKLLEGTGKNLRHVKITSAAIVSTPAISTLLRQAIAAMKKQHA
jgi:hypothetical protein